MGRSQRWITLVVGSRHNGKFALCTTNTVSVKRHATIEKHSR